MLKVLRADLLRTEGATCFSGRETGGEGRKAAKWGVWDFELSNGNEVFVGIYTPQTPNPSGLKQDTSKTRQG